MILGKKFVLLFMICVYESIKGGGKMEADYKIKAYPIGSGWNEADKIEVSLVLETGRETKTFKGIISLFGISMKAL